MTEETSLAKVEIPVERIVQRIFVIRGIKVMLDKDLAELYGVSTKVLNQAVKRNRIRFPADFMFQLSDDEFDQFNRSQIVDRSQKHRDPRFKPYAFTEHGVSMLSAVLEKQARGGNEHIYHSCLYKNSPITCHQQRFGAKDG